MSTVAVVVDERYLDARELAQALGVSVSVVKRWTRAGMPSYTWGLRVRRYKLSEVEEWTKLREGRAGPVKAARESQAKE